MVAHRYTWDDIKDQARLELGQARRGLSEARDWLKSDCPGQASDRDQRREAMDLICEAKELMDQAMGVMT